MCFVFGTTSILVLLLSYPSVYCASRTLSSEGELSDREADYSSPSGCKVMNA